MEPLIRKFYEIHRQNLTPHDTVLTFTTLESARRVRATMREPERWKVIEATVSRIDVTDEDKDR